MHSSEDYADLNDNEEDIDIEITDGLEEDNLDTTSTSTTTTPPPSFVMQTSPPAIYLTRPIKLAQSGGQETIVGVSGTALESEYLQDMMYSVTDSEDWSCRQGSSRLACYLIDTSGYLLASNAQNDMDGKVQIGDFLGKADYQIMDYFNRSGFFRQRVEFNYQALCPTKIECKAEAGAALLLPRLFFTSLINGLLNLLRDLSWHVYTLALTSMIWQPTSSSGVSEYTKQVTEGLHRCTTNTTHWEWRDEIEKHHGRIEVNCRGTHCEREIHAYKLKNLNAIMVFAEPKWCTSCKSRFDLFDGPHEIPSNNTCSLPNRYRSRPEDCFAVHEDEVMECKSSATLTSTFSSLIIPALVLTQSLP